MRRRLDEQLALAQGAFYIASGLWPIVHLQSFEAITGPKPEGWLVKTVGALIAVGGASMAYAGARRVVGPPTVVLAAGSAAALAAVDVWYAGVRRRIHPVYLLDAAVELGLLALWGVARRARPAAARSDDAAAAAIGAVTPIMVE